MEQIKTKCINIITNTYFKVMEVTKVSELTHGYRSVHLICPSLSDQYHKAKLPNKIINLFRYGTAGPPILGESLGPYAGAGDRDDRFHKGGGGTGVPPSSAFQFCSPCSLVLAGHHQLEYLEFHVQTSAAIQFMFK